MDLIHTRLRDELVRLQVSVAQAARNAGLDDSQGLRDVMAGRKRLSAELLAALVKAVGVDPHFVLTGELGTRPPEVLTAEEAALLGLYRDASKDVRRAALGALVGAQPERSVVANNRGGVHIGQVGAGGKVSVKKVKQPKPST